jgi:hypothetical protein
LVGVTSRYEGRGLLATLGKQKGRAVIYDPAFILS